MRGAASLRGPCKDSPKAKAKPPAPQDALGPSPCRTLNGLGKQTSVAAVWTTCERSISTSTYGEGKCTGKGQGAKATSGSSPLPQALPLPSPGSCTATHPPGPTCTFKARG